MLTPCDNSQSQRFFFVSQTHITPTATLWDPRLVVTVRGANSANHTPLVLAPATPQPNAAGRWGRQQVDTTPYDWARVVATVGAYAFKAFGSKCIDIGGSPHPEHSPAFLNDCNGTLAQSFKLRSVDEHLGYYNITVLDTPGLTSNPLTPKGHAVDRCLDIAGSVPSAGAHVELNACSGATSQRFAFDNFDRQYIYPAGTPELAIGLAGVRKENGALLELQTRATVASQDWRPIPVEHQVIGPKAPAIRFGKLRTVDHRDGTDVVYYTPLLMARDDAALDANYEMFWKRLGGSEYTHRALSGASTGIGQILNGRLPEIRSGVYVAKARATAPNGLFSESPEITIDARGLELSSLTIQGVDDDGATVRWQAAGTPRVSRFDVRFRPVGVGPTLEWQVAAEPGTGMANVSYQKQAVNLQPNTMYEVSVSARSDLWNERSAQTSTMTLPSPSTDPPPPPPPPPVSGISRVNVFNCVGRRRPRPRLDPRHRSKLLGRARLRPEPVERKLVSRLRRTFRGPAGGRALVLVRGGGSSAARLRWAKRSGIDFLPEVDLHAAAYGRRGRTGSATSGLLSGVARRKCRTGPSSIATGRRSQTGGAHEGRHVRAPPHSVRSRPLTRSRRQE